jgi:hypothetical protein
MSLFDSFQIDFDAPITRGRPAKTGAGEKAKPTSVASKQVAGNSHPRAKRLAPISLPSHRVRHLLTQECRSCGESFSFVAGDFIVHEEERRKLSTWVRVQEEVWGANEARAFLAQLPLEIYTSTEHVEECYTCTMLALATGALTPAQTLHDAKQLSLNFSERAPHATAH